MISIIFTIVLMGVMVYVFVLDGNKGNVFIKKIWQKRTKIIKQKQTNLIVKTYTQHKITLTSRK